MRWMRWPYCSPLAVQLPMGHVRANFVGLAVTIPPQLVFMLWLSRSPGGRAHARIVDRPDVAALGPCGPGGACGLRRAFTGQRPGAFLASERCRAAAGDQRRRAGVF